jgi:putative ABC transport system ATP-binding protein
LSNTVIHADNVRLSLNSRAGLVEILRGVSLSISAGEAVAIVGPSGSGKTSLLMVLAGLERATSGRVQVAGRDLGALDEDELALARGSSMGIVFQSFHLVPTMTALENVALPLEFQDQADASVRARELLDEVGLSHRLQHFPAQLSGGEQQRVALARALVTRPRVLLADEPTGNLDGTTGTHVMDLLFSAQARRNTTLVLVTHDEKLAQRCSRVVRMSDGNIVPATPEPVAA